MAKDEISRSLGGVGVGVAFIGAGLALTKLSASADWDAESAKALAPVLDEFRRTALRVGAELLVQIDRIEGNEYRRDE